MEGSRLPNDMPQWHFGPGEQDVGVHGVGRGLVISDLFPVSKAWILVARMTSLNQRMAALTRWREGRVEYEPNFHEPYLS